MYVFLIIKRKCKNIYYSFSLIFFHFPTAWRMKFETSYMTDLRALDAAEDSLKSRSKSKMKIGNVSLSRKRIRSWEYLIYTFMYSYVQGSTFFCVEKFGKKKYFNICPKNRHYVWIVNTSV